MAIGERLFMNYCAQCHGSDARGAKSFPNLTDGDWLGGTGHDYIKTTIGQRPYRCDASHGCCDGFTPKTCATWPTMC